MKKLRAVNIDREQFHLLIFILGTIMQEMQVAEIEMVGGAGNAMIGRVADSLAAAALPAMVFGPEASAAFLLCAGGFYAVNAFL